MLTSRIYQVHELINSWELWYCFKIEL